MAAQFSSTLPGPSMGNLHLPATASDAEICVEHPYELFCKVPALSSFYTQYEKTFSGYDMAFWFSQNVWMPCFLATLYLFLCYQGQKWMANRPAFKLQRALAMWNLGLSIFSTIAVIRVVPHLALYVYTKGLHYTVCAPSPLWFGNGTQAFWVLMFVASKIPELFDTMFIVLRKRKLIFLHWYHHTTVLVITWYAGSTMASSGLWFVAMNFSVHSIMYFYYFLSAIGKRVSWAPLVTALQISQMFMGCFLCLKISIAKFSGQACHVPASAHLLTCGMYASYLYLFCHFAWFRFGPGRKARKGTKIQKAKDEEDVRVTGSVASDSVARRRKAVDHDIEQGAHAASESHASHAD